MILNHQEILAAVGRGEIIIKPFDKRQVQPASYDFRVGRQGVSASRKQLVDIETGGYLQLEAGDVAVITTLEEVSLDNQHVGRLGLRSKYARKGLVASTGPQIDPGFHGRIILSLINLAPNPITLSFKESLVTVEFHRLEKPTDRPYSGPYQDKLEIGAEEIEFITEQASASLPEIIKTLGILSADVAGLRDSVQAMEATFRGIKESTQESIASMKESTRQSISSIKWFVGIIITFGIAVMATIAAMALAAVK